jgi:hypothetical protein
LDEEKLILIIDNPKLNFQISFNIVVMGFLESQDILLVILKTFGFIPIDFGGKYKKFKNHLYNFLVTITLIVSFSMVGVTQVNQVLVNTTEKDSALGHLMALIGVVSAILCFAIIKLYLLVKSDVQEKYFDMVRDLEIIVRSYHVKNTKVNKIIEDLRKSTLRQEIILFAFYIFLNIFLALVATTNNVLMYVINGIFYDIFNCFFIQILIFLKMNMNLARKIQNHINQVLLSLQKFDKHFDVEDFIEIHRKIKQYLAALNAAFGFIFFMTFLEISGSMIPYLYKCILTLTNPNYKISINGVIYINLCFIWALHSYYHLRRLAFECDCLHG